MILLCICVLFLSYRILEIKETDLSFHDLKPFLKTLNVIVYENITTGYFGV